MDSIKRGEVNPAQRDAYLGELADAASYRNLVERMITTAVLNARAHGATWGEVGKALGITHQGARKRFGLPTKKAS